MVKFYKKKILMMEEICLVTDGIHPTTILNKAFNSFVKSRSLKMRKTWKMNAPVGESETENELQKELKLNSRLKRWRQKKNHIKRKGIPG